MLDTQTKKRIDDCRDILVGKLPDPKAQIEQITIALIYKFMDDMDKEVIDLGGKAKFFTDYKTPNPEFPNDRKKDILVPFSNYSWDNLFNAKVTAAEMLRLYSEAIAGMDKNPNIPQLFRDIFKNAFLPYRDPETLKLFLKTIGEFEYTHSEKLGDAFEYLLSVMGSQGDAGQFRTPRHIIDFLIALINPTKKDKILDPACGTAGFLIAAYKHILLQNTKANTGNLNIYQYNKLPEKPFNNLGDKLTPDEKRKLVKNFTGYDISPDMVRLSLVNLYLHQFPNPNIFEYDTLSSEDRWDETATVVAANPPFMSPKGGIRPHKKFSIASNRSEVLFVDYIAEHLSPDGRAGIIVPEGIIFQSGTAYKELRKMLVENYLYAVVSLPAGVFNPYSGVKTSILLMDKQLAKQRNEILFVKIDNDGYNLGAQRNEIKGGQLEDAIEMVESFRHSGLAPESLIAHAVAKKEIAKNGDYNLSGERYKNITRNDSSYEIVSLGDENFFKIVSGGTPSSEVGEYWNGEINWATLADLPATEMISNISSTTRKITEEGLKNSSAKLLPVNSVLVSTRATIGRIAINQTECCTNQGFKNIIINDFTKANTYFVALMMTNLVDKMNSMATGGTFKELSTSSFRTLQIPLPPLPIQQEIVAEIEGWQKIIDGAKAVVQNYKPTIAINPDWEMVELGEVCEKVTDGSHFSPEISDSGYPYITVKDLSDGKIDLVNCKKISEVDYKELVKNGCKPLIDDVLFSKDGTVGKTALIDFDSHFVVLSSLAIVRANKEIILPKFLYNIMSTDFFINKAIDNKTGVAIRRIVLKTLKTIKIPLPPLATQRQIVSQIEKEQALVQANKELIALFEQKIKDRIAKVWGSNTKEPVAYEENDMLTMAPDE